MIIDKSTQFANAVALNTGASGSYYNHGDVIDIRDLRDIGRGRPSLYLMLLVTTTVTSGGSATVRFILGSDSQQPLRTDGTSENIHFQTVDIPKATLTAGYQLAIPIPLQNINLSGAAVPPYARYVGLQIYVGTAALTAGAASAELVLDPDSWLSYNSAVFA
jgi:hypothetical protein